MRRPLSLIWQRDPDSPATWERDWMTEIFGSFDVEHVVDLANEVVLPHAVVVTNGESKPETATGGGSTNDYLGRFRSAGLKPGVVHLSDEFEQSPLDFYRQAAFVARNYWRRQAMALPNAEFIALGYKTGFGDGLTVRSASERHHRWSFAGQVKTSRAIMLDAAEQIPGGRAHLTHQFDDPNGLSTTAYADLMADSVFVLSPRGNRSVDCFRVYEALEAGAIPIVEDDAGPGFWSDLASPSRFVEYGMYRPSYWRANRRRLWAGSYWLRAFGPEFPCPRIHHWQRLPELIDAIDVEATADRVGTWWRRYKSELVSRLQTLVEQSVDDDGIS